VITVSMAAVIDAPRARVWRALTSPQELIRWDDRVVALARGKRPGNGRPQQRYRWGSVCVDLRYRPIEVIPGKRLRSEISLGLFLASSIAGLLIAFPPAILGAMMLLVGLELAKLAKDVSLNRDLAPMGATLVVSILTNMAYGFLAGLAVHHAMRAIRPPGNRPTRSGKESRVNNL